MSQHRVKAQLYYPGSAPMRPISLPLRSMPNGVPVSHWTSPDWEDNGWDKAMRECAKRLNDAGIIVVLLEADEK